MKIGLIQPRGIGDIVIAAPIAQYFIGQGHEVFWPVDRRFHSALQAAFPAIHFMPVDPQQTGDVMLAYFYSQPPEQLQQVNCSRIHDLYSYLLGLDIVNQTFARSLKFDEYKYAVASVLFSEKWNLKITLNLANEQKLTDKMQIECDYVLPHEDCSNFRLSIALSFDHAQLLDWIGVTERASTLTCIDCDFANPAQQLN